MSIPTPTAPSRRPASLGRRVLPALVLTGTGVGLLASLDRPGAEVSAAPVTTSATTAASGAVLGAGAAPTTTAPTATVAAGATATTAAATTVPATPAVCTGWTFTGPVVATRWGDVQVAATVSADGVLCDVEALQHPTGDRRSDSINAQALPVLHDRAVAAGSAGFQAVSGATVTSEGYRASLQAILDAA